MIQRRIDAGRKWIARRWLIFAVVTLGAAAWALAGVAWELAGRPVDGTEGQLGQLQALVAVVEFGLASVVGLGVLYQAQQSGRTFR